MVDWTKLLSDLAADGTAISFDIDGEDEKSVYDRIYRLIADRGILPRSQRNRIALVAAVLTASRVLKQRLGPLGPVANFADILSDDTVREMIKRLLEDDEHALQLSGEKSEPFRLRPIKRLDDAMGALASGIFPWTNRKKYKR